MEDARLDTRTATPSPILIAAGGSRAAGLVATASDPALVRAFEEAGGCARPRHAELTVCWGPDEGAARRTAHRLRPIAALSGALLSEPPRPAHVEQAARLVDEAAVARVVVCGPDPRPSSRRSRATRRRASTTSGCTRWGPTRRAVSTSARGSSCRASARARTRAG